MAAVPVPPPPPVPGAPPPQPGAVGGGMPAPPQQPYPPQQQQPHPQGGGVHAMDPQPPPPPFGGPPLPPGSSPGAIMPPSMPPDGNGSPGMHPGPPPHAMVGDAPPPMPHPGVGYGPPPASPYPEPPTEGFPVTYWVEELYPDEDYQFKMIQRQGAQQDGVRIIEVGEGGAFHRAGVRPGRLVSINRIAVFTLHGVKNLLLNMREAGIARFPITVIPDPGAPRQPTYDPRVHGDPSAFDVGFGIAPPGSPGAMNNGPMTPGSGRRGQIYPSPYGGNAPGDQDNDEFMARKLAALARYRRNGDLSEDQYKIGKERLLAVMLDAPARGDARYPAPQNGGAAEFVDGLLAPLLAPTPPPPPPAHGPPPPPVHLSPHHHSYQHTHPTAPLYEWGQTNKKRYIYLRHAPNADAPWVYNGGVYGMVQILHCVGDWMCVRTDEGVTGFIRARYITYLPKGPHASPRTQIPPQVSSPVGRGYGDMGSPFSPSGPGPSVVDPVREYKDYYNPVEQRWVRVRPRDDDRDRDRGTDVSFL